MITERIVISWDFSASPGGRYRAHGPNSAEAFREDHLLPALRRADKVELNMDGCMGFAPCWIEEVFGGAVRAIGITELDNKLHIETESAALHGQVLALIQAARITELQDVMEKFLKKFAAGDVDVIQFAERFKQVLAR